MFMHEFCTRRLFLRRTLPVVPCVAIVRGFGAPQAVPTVSREGRGLTVYQLGPIIWVRLDNRVLLSYRAHESQKYPYIYPVAGPVTGLSLTAETALPWPHHRSLFFACDRVNGGNYWQEEFAAGQVVSAGPTVGPVTNNAVEIRDVCEWHKPGEPAVMRDERHIKVTVAGSNLYSIDWAIKWIAQSDVTIQKTNHSLFALRAAPDITPLNGGALVNAQGASGEKATFGQRSEWCAFYGKRNSVKDGQVEGIALFDHPKNPWSPCQWFTRDYGFMSPTPFNFRDEPWKLAAGQSVILRYLVVAHAGAPEEAGLQELYLSWVAGG